MFTSVGTWPCSYESWRSGVWLQCANQTYQAFQVTNLSYHKIHCNSASCYYYCWYITSSPRFTWSTSLSTFSFYRQLSMANIGSPSFHVRTSTSESQQTAWRTLLRTHHQDLLQRRAGNGWTTWREQRMTTPWRWLMSSQSDAPSSLSVSVTSTQQDTSDSGLTVVCSLVKMDGQHV